MTKRTFGTVDELPSGRFRARYRGPDGRRHAKVFSTRADAWAWLATQQTDLLRKAWRAPTASRRTVGDYAEDYLARSNWNSTFRRAADAIGLPAVRPHELRHTGATLAAATGATTKELMRRLGHSSPAAALLYQHAVDDRDAAIARALDAMLGAASESSDDDPDWND